jgi:allantoate deiminase
MREAGMTANIDAMGNCVGRYEGAQPGLPCLMLGSHLDTVRDAGQYDGMLGVLSAIECVAALNATGTRLPFAIEVVGFGDEEGVRFGSTLLGSRAIAGTFDPAVLAKTDADGITMHDALTSFGIDPARYATAARRPGQVLAYAELHIEQGPVLEAAGLPVGVVTAINGGNRFTFELTGMAGHAGTVPMGLRRDALAAAAECVVAVERIAASMPEVVGTVGRIEARPGAMNVIPGKVTFSLDVRAPTDDKRHAAVAAIHAEIAAIAQRRNIGLAVTPMWEARTAPCALELQKQFAAAIHNEGIHVHHLPSGAGHDGMAIIDIAPIGMLFVRCEGGISHNPAEAVTLDDVATGARVLARFILAFTPPSRTH